MLVAHPKTLDPTAQLMANLFNEVHSLSGFMSGVKLALVVDRAVTVRELENGPVQLFALQKRGPVHRARTSIAEFLRVAPEVGRAEVLLARWGLSQDVERMLHRWGWKREIEGQVSGRWYPAADQVPMTEPSSIPSGAVIPSAGHRVGDGSPCLDLVLVDYVWYPLSEAGLYSYGHSSELARGTPMVFVPVESPGTRWPTVLSASLAKPIEPERIGKLYGDSAMTLARTEYPSVRVRLSRLKSQ